MNHIFLLKECEIPIALSNSSCPINMWELSKLSNKSYSFTHQTVKKMKKFNLVNLSKNERKFLVSLTEDGKEITELLKKIKEADKNSKEQT